MWRGVPRVAVNENKWRLPSCHSPHSPAFVQFLGRTCAQLRVNCPPRGVPLAPAAAPTISPPRTLAAARGLKPSVAPLG